MVAGDEMLPSFEPIQILFGWLLVAEHQIAKDIASGGYLRDIDRQAKTMFSQVVKQMATQEGITEKLKSTDQMAWVGAMNSIRQRAAETVSDELIYQ